MIRLRISKRVLRLVVLVVLTLGILGGLYFLGNAVTPRGSDGRPLVLSPSLRAAQRYRARAREWVAEMADLDRRLERLLSAGALADPTELYIQSQEMQKVGEAAAALVREIGATEVPVALVGLQQQARAAADAYLEASRLTALWLSAPSEAGRQEALTALYDARALRVKKLEQSPWMQNPWKQ